MTKYKRLLVPAVLAAGTMLLTACDIGADIGASADGKQNTSTTANSTPADPTAGGAVPVVEGKVNPADGPVEEGSVDCGRVDLGGGDPFRLIADPGVIGLVNCHVAFDVFNDYLAIPEDARKEGVTLANGWGCSSTVEADVLYGFECSQTDPSSPTADLANDYQFRVEPVK